MNKRGSHVEIIISFIIFVTFIFFLFSIVEPTVSTQKDKKNLFDHLEYEIIKKISSNMTTISVLIDSESGCVSLTNLISDFDIENNIIVKNSSGKNIESHVNGDSLQINIGSVSEKLFKIYYSKEFEELDVLGPCSEKNYEIGFTKTSKYIFQKKMTDLINEDYQALKTELKISEGVDFGYGIILSNGTILETQEGELSTNVYVRESPIEYIDSNGNLLEGYLKIKIW